MEVVVRAGDEGVCFTGLDHQHVAGPGLMVLPATTATFSPRFRTSEHAGAADHASIRPPDGDRHLRVPGADEPSLAVLGRYGGAAEDHQPDIATGRPTHGRVRGEINRRSPAWSEQQSDSTYGNRLTRADHGNHARAGAQLAGCAVTISNLIGW